MRGNEVIIFLLGLIAGQLFVISLRMGGDVNANT